jgi:hypothetical protein
MLELRASLSGVQCVTLQKYLSHLSLVILLFLHLTHVKLKLGLQMQIIGERLLIANHLQQSLLLTNQK